MFSEGEYCPICQKKCLDKTLEATKVILDYKKETEEIEKMKQTLESFGYTVTENK